MKQVDEAEATTMTAREFEDALVRSDRFSRAAAKVIASRMDEKAAAVTFAEVERKTSGFILSVGVGAKAKPAGEVERALASGGTLGRGTARFLAARRGARIGAMLEDLEAATQSLRRSR
jgi:hypothetical protein